jgi:hypothetical protein
MGHLRDRRPSAYGPADLVGPLDADVAEGPVNAENPAAVGLAAR